MSPRRRLEADERDFFDAAPKPPRRWDLPLIAVLAALLIAASITGSTLMLIQHVKDDRSSAKEANALGYVREFMTAYTTLDPFHANDYADRILAQRHPMAATGSLGLGRFVGSGGARRLSRQFSTRGQIT